MVEFFVFVLIDNVFFVLIFGDIKEEEIIGVMVEYVFNFL